MQPAHKKIGLISDTHGLLRPQAVEALRGSDLIVHAGDANFSDKIPLASGFGWVGCLRRPWDVIVGIVGDVKQTSLAATQSDAVYVVSSQWLWCDGTMSLVARNKGDAASMVPVIKQAIWSVDKEQPVIRVSSMDDLIAASAAERSFALILFEAFGILALVLAATGIYGVVSSSVAERTREIGVRAALGASPLDLLTLILRQGFFLTGIGMAVGLAGAVIANQSVATLLFGISQFDLVTYAGVIALLLGVSLGACGVPALRAARVDPLVALRYE